LVARRSSPALRAQLSVTKPRSTKTITTTIAIDRPRFSVMSERATPLDTGRPVRF
jgi:hypothetical protein